MGSDYLTLDIQYNINNDQFKIGGNVNKEGEEEVIGNFLREQKGAGKDEAEAIRREIYNIELKWYPKNDRIESSSDTGNRKLRDGILVHYLESLGK